MFVISACSSVDLPEPVLPATSTCCEVPWPSRRRCSFVAPARPSGTSNPWSVLPAQSSMLRRRDVFERHLDAARVLGAFARHAHDLGKPLFVGQRIDGERERAKVGIAPDELAVAPQQARAVAAPRR